MTIYRLCSILHSHIDGAGHAPARGNLRPAYVSPLVLHWVHKVDLSQSPLRLKYHKLTSVLAVSISRHYAYFVWKEPFLRYKWRNRVYLLIS